MGGRELSGRRSHVCAFVFLADRLLGLYASGDRLGRLRYPASPRSPRPRPVASHFADLHRYRFQLDAACGRHRDQFFGAAVFRLGFRALAEGARRGSALGHFAGGIRRRPRRGPTGRQFVSTGSAVCAGECGHVWQRHRRGARHEQDRVGKHAVDVADGDARGIPRLPAGLRIPLADAGRRRAFRIDGSGQRCGAVLVDQGAARCAGHGGVAILLFSIGVVANPRLLRVGRYSDNEPAGRIWHRRRVGIVPALSRGAARDGNPGRRSQRSRRYAERIRFAAARPPTGRKRGSSWTKARVRRR